MKTPLNCLVACIAMAVGAGTGIAQAAEPDAAVGRSVYERWCSHCHDPGMPHPGTNALTVKYKGIKSGVIREWTDLTPTLVAFWVRNGISVMPPFRKTEITDAELAALGAYLAGGTADGKPLIPSVSSTLQESRR